MGPFVIVTSIKDTYTCRNRVTEDNEDYHVSKLCEFHFQQKFVNPKDVAMRDNEEFVVDSIQEHRGDVTRLTSLEFRIRWLGYDATHNTWEPWKGLRATEGSCDTRCSKLDSRKAPRRKSTSKRSLHRTSWNRERSASGQVCPKLRNIYLPDRIDKPYFFHNVCRGFLGRQGLQ